MEASKKERYAVEFFACLVIAGGLCIAQINGSQLLILSVLFLFLLLVSAADWKGKVTPVLLFFLPWSTILKLYSDGISFFTIALLLACILKFIKGRFTANIHCMIIAIFFLAETLLSKCISGSGIELSYLMFLFLLFFFPLLIQELNSKVNYKMLTVFFSAGIIFAALSAMKLEGYDNISKYINVYSWNGIVRFSGYYGDPNFYSAHISAALSGVLLFLLEKKKGTERFAFVLLALGLLYCGFMSGSKAFVFVTVILFVLWLAALVMMKERATFKIFMFAGVTIMIGFVFSSSVFAEVLEVISLRFSNVSDMSTLTTGRTEIWAMYARGLLGDLKLFLFGTGLTNVKLHGWGSHNTLLQSFYQFGIIGSALLVSWFLFGVKDLIKKYKQKWKVSYIVLLFAGAFLPWMALDMVYFDELFLIPMYVTAGCIYFFKDERIEKQGVDR